MDTVIKMAIVREKSQHLKVTLVFRQSFETKTNRKGWKLRDLFSAIQEKNAKHGFCRLPSRILALSGQSSNLKA